LNIENHYGLGKVICNKYGLDFIAEAGGPGPPVHNCPFEALKSLGSLDVPRGEFWYEHPQGDEHMHELQIIKGPASAAHLYDQKYVEAEAFTSVWLWQEGPGDIKMVADKAMCEGLNRFIYHTFPHIPPEAGLPGWVYNFGTLINTTRTWWPKSAAFHMYLARCCYMLQQGHFVGDVLYYYGDQAPNFVDPKHIDPSLGPGYDYDVCNSEIILDRLDVQDGKLVLPHGQSYEILVLPDQNAINPDVLDKIKQLAQKGATIVGRKPVRSHSLNDFEQHDIQVQKLADELWGEIDGVDITEHQYGNGKIIWGKTLREVLLERGITPDLETVSPGDSTMPDYIHRRSGKADIYFIRNVNDFELETDVLFRVSGKVPELWDPDKGTKTGQYVYADDGNRIRMPLQLPPLGSVFVVFREVPEKEHYNKVFMDKKQVFPMPEEGKTITRPAGFCIDQTGVLTSGTPGQYRLVSGKNKEYNITIPEIPPAKTIDGPWEVRFPHGHGAPGRVDLPELISWTESEDAGIKYFSGIAAYHKTVTLADDFSTENKKMILDLGHVSKVADVYVNGWHLGILWHPPWQVDITDAVKPGKNNLIVEVANVLSNQLTGDAMVPEQFKRTNSNIVKGPNAWMTPWKDVPLVESGLLGPVKIKFLHRITL